MEQETEKSQIKTNTEKNGMISYYISIIMLIFCVFIHTPVVIIHTSVKFIHNLKKKTCCNIHKSNAKLNHQNKTKTKQKQNKRQNNVHI